MLAVCTCLLAFHSFCNWISEASAEALVKQGIKRRWLDEELKGVVKLAEGIENREFNN